MITKNKPQKFGLTREQFLLQSLEKYATPKEYKFTLQRVRLRLHLLNLKYDPSKVYFTVTCKIMDTSNFTKRLNPSQA